jgi:5-formyltetrahydrofolate cyclo-ligase
MTGDKVALRKMILKARRSLPSEYRQMASKAIMAILLECEAYRRAEAVMAYASMADEVQLQGLLEHSLKAGKFLALPYVISQGMMGAARVKSLAALTEGAYGILTVAEEGRVMLPPGSLDLIVVPGVAFGLDGSRLGMGAGFYDRFLSEREPQARRIALCFDCQLAEEIPMEVHDQRVEAIITETRFIDCRRGN